MKALMCEPRHYGVRYEINPWMDLRCKVDHQLARRQWEILRDAIRECGVEVLFIEGVAGLPDMVFTANAGWVYRNRAFVSSFKFAQRQGEREHFRAWFQRAGYQVEGEGADAGAFFEGQGDALFLDQTLFAGYGIRSERSFFDRLATVGIEPIVHCGLVDPYFYHLDTCFLPLSDGLALWWPEAFDPASRRRMEEVAELWPVPEQEARRFACNGVRLGDQVLIPEGCPLTRAFLESRGLGCRECGMSEFIKAGGACKCLVLLL